MCQVKSIIYNLNLNLFNFYINYYRWKEEGFCDNDRETRFTLRNPSHREYVQSECYVSCGLGCAANGHSEL
jgi:hypothetical protein